MFHAEDIYPEAYATTPAGRQRREPPRQSISYDTTRGIATFTGPGGFTQYVMPLEDAQAIGYALSIRVETTP